MRKTSSLPIAILFFVALGVAALHGRHVSHLRDAAAFYDWLVGASTEMRVEGRVGDPLGTEDSDPNAPKKVDTEFFSKIQDRIETAPGIPEITPDDKDINRDGSPSSKLVRIVRRAGENSDRDQWDELMWDIARGKEFTPEREQFLSLLRKHQLSTTGTQLALGNMYEGQGSTVSLANMFFGFRKMAANLLWLQVDKFWHKGQLFRMLPIMKTTVALDPHFVDAFLLGAWHLAYNATPQLPETPEPLKVYSERYQARVGPKEKLYYQAIEFLKDGIRKNPRNYKLYFDLGFAIYELKLQDHANAVHYLSEAIRYKHDKWVPRQLYIALQKNGEYDRALNGWRDYLAKNPDNEVAPRFVKINEALIKDRDGDRALKAGDTVKGNQLKEEARVIWQGIVDADGDPFALMHLRRNDALALAAQGRYHEAVALIDQARFEAPDQFEPLSDLLMRLKREGGLPYSLSEKMHLASKAEADKYIAEELNRITGRKYELREGVWYEEGYNNQEAQLVTPGSDALNALRGKNPKLGVILSFKQPLVLNIDGVWYRFQPRVEL